MKGAQHKQRDEEQMKQDNIKSGSKRSMLRVGHLLAFLADVLPLGLLEVHEEVVEAEGQREGGREGGSVSAKLQAQR